jgi:hypothetical protein
MFSTLPAVEIEQELRERLEGVLHEGETLETFVVCGATCNKSSMKSG